MAIAFSMLIELPNAPGKNHLLQILQGKPDILEQGHIAGEHGRFGPHEVVDVPFAQSYVPAALSVGAATRRTLDRSPRPANARVFKSSRNLPLGAEVCLHQRCQQIDQARAADLGLDHAMVMIMGSKVSGLMLTSSIAPLVARIP